MMELIPAVDLLEGAAVRLVQGDYARPVGDAVDAPTLARRFAAAGCRRLHVVDLDGARAGRPAHLPLLADVASAARDEVPQVVVEAGGGLRSADDVERVLAIADEAILGTAAIEVPGFLRTCADRFPGRVTVSLDLRDGRAALDGWSRTGGEEALAIADRMLADGAARLIVTDTGRDGTLGGPNLGLLGGLRAAFPDAILVAAGGVGSLDDLRALHRLGLDGAVVGVALLTGAIDPAEALAVLA